MSYFFDSYAIIEVINRNPRYEQFAHEKIITTVLNLGEVYFYFLKMHNKATADYWMRMLRCEVLEIPLDVALEAAAVRFEHRTRAFSYPDCIGYTTALRRGLQFLTGDRAFKDMPNVAFAK